MRENLLLWGLLLLAGAVLFLQWRAVVAIRADVIRGPGPLSWGSVVGAWASSNSIALGLSLLGFLAACFGGLHLKRPDARPSPARRAAS